MTTNPTVVNLGAALSAASVDDVAQVVIAHIVGLTVDGSAVTVSAADIAGQVTPHVHHNNDESYIVVGGTGLMFIAPVDSSGEPAWGPPMAVGPGDSFTIPAGHAHCLRRTGDTPLRIAFIGSSANLTSDRTVVSEPPSV